MQTYINYKKKWKALTDYAKDVYKKNMGKNQKNFHKVKYGRLRMCLAPEDKWDLTIKGRLFHP